jgi:hypothetical protein
MRLLSFSWHDIWYVCRQQRKKANDTIKKNEKLEKYIKDFFGSHRFIVEYAESVRKELKPLPFFGAIYRVGHPCSHSSSLSIWRRFFFKKYLISNPKELILRIFSLTIFGRQIKNDFLGLEHYGDSQ